MTDYCQYEPDESMINFGIGQPNKSTLNLNLIKESLQENLNNPDKYLLDSENILQYSNVQGISKLLDELAIWLNKKYLEQFDEKFIYDNSDSMENFKDNDNFIEIDRKNLMLTNGITDAIRTIILSLSSSNDVILVEDPTYYLMMDIFYELELKVHPIKLTRNGIDLEELTIKLEEFSSEQNFIFLYCSPINSNPSGITISHDHRLQLSELASCYNNFYILADEIYHLLSWEKQNVFPMSYYNDNFISMNSFSKILGPSLRFGFIHCRNEYFLDDLKNNSFLNSSGGTNVLSSIIILPLLKNNLIDEHLNNVKKDLQKKCNCMIDNLKEISEFIEFDIPKGGYFLWITLNLHKIFMNSYLQNDFNNFCKLCNLYGVKFSNNYEYLLRSSDNENDVFNKFRLSFSYYSEEKIKEGINLIKDVINSLLKVGIVILINSNTNNNYERSLEKIKDVISKIKILQIIDIFDFGKNNDFKDKVLFLFQIIKLKNNKIILIDLTEDCEIKYVLKELYDKDNLKLICDEHSTNVVSSIINKLPIMMLENSLNKLQNEKEYTLLLKYINSNFILSIPNFQKNDLLFHGINQDNEYLIKQYLYYLLTNNRSLEFPKNIFDNLPKVEIINFNKKSCYIFENVNIKDQHYLDIFVEESTNLNQKIFIISKQEQIFGSYVLKFKYKYDDKESFCANSLLILYNYIINSIKKNNDKSIFIRKKYYLEDALKDNIFELELIDNDKLFSININIKPIIIRYENHLNKVKNLLSEYNFEEVRKVELINVLSPHIVICCKSNVLKFDEDMIVYLTEKIKECLNANFLVVFCNVDKEKEFSVRCIDDDFKGFSYLASYFSLIKDESFDDFFSKEKNYYEEKFYSHVHSLSNSENNKLTLSCYLTESSQERYRVGFF